MAGVSDEWMSASDSILWHIERDPRLRSTITGILVLGSAPDPHRLAATLTDAPRSAPRLGQRVVVDPLALSPPRWVPAEDDPADHLTVVNRPGGGLADVLEVAADLHSAPLDRGRPLWDMHLVEGLGQGRAAAIIRSHHAMADGLGLVAMMGAFVDLEADPPDRRFGPAPRADPPSILDPLIHRLTDDVELGRRLAGRTLATVGSLARHPVHTVLDGLTTATSIARLVAPARTPRSPLMTGRSSSCDLRSVQRPLDALRQAAHLRDASINDLFVAAVIEALHRYHHDVGSELTELRLTMPISVRNGEQGGNHFVPARFVVPAGPGQDRVSELRSHLARQRGEPALPHLDEISTLIERAGPRAATTLMASMLTAVDAVVSDVPGPPMALWLAGSPIEALIAFGPCAGAALNATLVSYHGSLTIGLSSDRAAVDDPDRLARHLGDALDELTA